MYKYIFATLETKMPIMCSNDIEGILEKYNYVVKKEGRPYKLFRKKYNGESDETIIKFLNDRGYYAYKKYIIFKPDFNFRNDTTYLGDELPIPFSKLIELIVVNVRKYNIDKLID